MKITEPTVETLRILITVKTYPIPSSSYDELVCTAGVLETGDFVRLYPVNYRELDYTKQYKKYQWIEVQATRHSRRDSRKESYRPDCDSLVMVGEPIGTQNYWAERARYILPKRARSMEELAVRQKLDRTSLGVIRPASIDDLQVTSDTPEWKPGFVKALRQVRLFETRDKTLTPPRKVPFKFHHRFRCADSTCRGHRMMIEDWEVGALYWKLVDGGRTPERAAEMVRDKFFHHLCAPSNDTHFFVGTVNRHPTSWVVIGLFYPKADPQLTMALY